MFLSQKIRGLRSSAEFFEKEGIYTPYRKGTSEYRKFWIEQARRSLYGYEVDGFYIPGYFYYYLNFSRIDNTFKKVIMHRGIEQEIAWREESFPDFWDYDYEYFMHIEKCEKMGKFTSVIKARRKGYSFKAGSMMDRNYHLIPGSKSYAIAFEKEFLIKDGLLTKAWNTMDFVDTHTAWSRLRQRKNDIMHRRSSYIDEETGIEKGFKSEIIGVSVRHDPHKVRGKAAKLIFLEEAGNFPQLINTWNIASDSIKEGDIVLGLMIAFGTGGEEGADFEGLKKIFFHPKAFNCLEVPYTWDDLYNKPTGFFVPIYKNLKGFIGDDGVSLEQEALDYEKEQRRIKEDSSDESVNIDQYIAEHPFNPFEAVLQLTGNIFPKKLLLEQLLAIEQSAEKINLGQRGTLRFKDKQVAWHPDDTLKAITEFPLEGNKNAEGCIVIYEHPDTDTNGLIPDDLYILGIDSYDYDSSNTDSLGSCLVYKRFYKPGHEYNLIVAEYTGRPSTADEFYENCRMLCLYYNGLAMYENENIGIEKHFVKKNSYGLLADAPKLKHIIKNSRVDRKKGVHMPIEVIGYGERLIKQYILKNDSSVYNYEKIFSPTIIKELISYNSKGNFDRVRAFMCVLIYEAELHDIMVKEEKYSSKEYMPRSIFQKRKNTGFK